MATLYVSPTGSGLRDGSSIQNAGTLGSLNKYIQQAGAGGQVLLLADQGAYQQYTQVSITAGGATGAPVTVRGIDSSGNPMAAEIAGTRAVDWVPGLSTGNEVFRLLSGANNLVFEDLSVKNVGNGVFRVGADISNLTIRDVDASNVTRFIEDYVSGTATSASIDGLTVQNVNVTGYSLGAIRLQYDTRNVVMENVVADSQGQNGGKYIFGVSLSGTVHDVLLSHVEMRNNYGNASATEYWNGDGFSTESGVYNVRFEDTVASGNTDAGYDLKSTNTVLVRAVSEGNNRNYRFWSDSITLEDSTSISPVHLGGNAGVAHVWIAANADVTIDGLTFSDALLPQTLFDMRDGGATLHLRDTVVPAPYQALVFLGNGSIIETNAAPTGIAMSGGSVEENAAAGTWVGALSAVDPDSGDSHSFALVGGATGLFEIVGTDIRVKAGAVLDFEIQPSHSLTILVTDQGGASYSQTVAVNLTNVVETGTAGNDVLTGGAGGDRLSGGAGNDTYSVNSTGDVVVEAASQGADLVNVSLAGYALGANVENLTFIGAGNFTGTGNTLNNVITSGVGNDTLRGNSGNDTIRGGVGNDLIYGEVGMDLVYAGDGADKVRRRAERQPVGRCRRRLGARRRWARLSPRLDGNDLLDGGADNDRMVGGAGDDTYVVNSTGDSATEKVNEGYDTVQSSVTYVLSAYLDDNSRSPAPAPSTALATAATTRSSATARERPHRGSRP